MDKQILNAIAEVLKEERKRSSIEIGEIADSIPNYDQQLDDIEKALSEFSEFTAVKKEHDSFLAAEIERIHETIKAKSESDSAVVSDLKQWASDFELKKEFEYLQFQEEFSELKEIALSVKDGEDGENGKDGTDGVDGRDGVDNPAIAPIHIDRNFKANKGLVVHHRGGLWQAIRNTNGDPEVDSGNWNCFVDGVTNVSSSFDPESALHSLHFEKTNGEKETISFERPPAYLPAGEHKSIDGDYFFDGTGLNVYVKGDWLGIDLKGEKGESGGRGRVGKRGVGVDDIIPTQDGFTFLMTDGQTKDVSFPEEIKDLIVDLIGTYSQEVDQEIRRYAGTWHSSKSYVSGDVVTLTGSLFLCLSNTSDSPESSDSWVQMSSQSGGGAYLSSDGDSGIGTVPDFVLTTQGGIGGTHLSEFKDSSSTLIKFVGVDENNKEVKATITTDMVQTNPLPFRNAKSGQFIGTPEELADLTNQRKVNEFFYKTLGEIEAGDIDLEGYATEAQLNEVDTASIDRDEKLQDQIDANKTQSEDGDKHLQVEIEEIALALETLLVSREHGQWKYVGYSGDTIPRNAGEFALLVDDIVSGNENIITLNQEDLKGITHGFADVEVGDYVEIVNTADPTSYALFTITKVPEGTGIVNVEVTLKDAGYNIWLGETCEIRFFAINEQDLNLTDLDNRYLKLSGGAMSGTLETPRFNVKKHDGEAICLIEGMTDGNATSARLTFSNKINANAYGNLTWNGNSGQGWFQFNKDVDFSSKNLHSVNNIRLSGAKTIQEGTNTRIKFENKVVIYKPGANGANRAGFVLKGGVDGNSDGNLLSVYHNASGLDSVDYYGKQEGENNIATVGYVDSKVGVGSPMSAKLQSGFQSWNEIRLGEGNFNLTDENGDTTSNCKAARGLTFHILQGFEEWPWMKYALRSGGQIHLTDMNGKYLMSKPVLSAEKRDAGSGDYPADALWHFELSIYGFEAETSLSGFYMVEFENCLEAG